MRLGGLKELGARSRTMRSPVVMAGVILAGGACAAGAVATPSSGPARSASADRCYATAFAPDLHYPTISSRGSFRCTATHRDVVLKVVFQVQREANGPWTRLAGAHETLDMLAGKTYTLLTKPLTCQSGAPKSRVRTHVREVVGDVKVTIAGSSPSL